MADPRVIGPQQRKANLSPLMEAKGRASAGEKLNFCPHGCTDEDLDDHGYCRHLVGFTLPGNDKLYEPMVERLGQRKVQVSRPIVKEPGVDKEDQQASWKWGKPQYQEVKKTDKLVRITVCSRVYRDMPKELSEDELEQATRPETANA